MMLPKISIVVIGHNEENKIGNCLQSVLNVDYPEDKKEIIYVDNFSTDGTLEKAACFPIQTIALKKKPPHPGAARNAGLDMATGEFVQFVDGDMELDPNWLRRALPYFQRTNTGCVVGRLRERRPDASLFNAVIDFSWRLKSLGVVGSPSGGGLFRREVLLRIDGYDEAMRASEEIDLGYKLRHVGYEIYSIDTVMANHDIDLRTFRQFLARSFRDGYSEIQLILKHFRWRLPLPQDYILKMNLQVATFVLLASIIVLTQQWFWMLPLISLPLLLVCRKTLRYGRQTGLWKLSFLYSFFLYLNMIPLVLGQGRFVWDRVLDKIKLR